MKNRFPALLIILHLLLLADTSAIVFLLSRQDYSTGLIFTIPAFILIIACIVIFAIYSGSSIRHISKMNYHLESSAAEFMVSAIIYSIGKVSILFLPYSW